MSSAITYNGHGYWLSNGLCESVYDYILENARKNYPAIAKSLEEDEGIRLPWEFSGFCPELEELVKVMKDENILAELLVIDEEILSLVTANDAWQNNLRKAILLTNNLFSGKLKTKLDSRNANFFKLTV